ncbi:RBBP9/YdeN family alpha/beta hydrolase [Rhodoferax sp.]|uniref:RBBP9/YdeN family alpha/beta hydrolase n=1 Tax=Rhodoferax sp. TaxID=50421 RepID=UPI00275F3DEF|nr:alpha/beta hydrolase [Rhodoferax sp.]
MSSDNILILPGWQDSGPGHWQTLWEARHGYLRVQQHDWLRPLRGDWIARLEDVLLARQAEGRAAAVLAAHSLGCQLVAAWAAHSHNTHLVQGALLVAPPDTERDDLRGMLPSWAPVPLGQLPFASAVFASSDDPFCALDRARRFAADWGADFVVAGARGHLNADSGLGHWPQAQQALQALIAGETINKEN